MRKTVRIGIVLGLFAASMAPPASAQWSVLLLPQPRWGIAMTSMGNRVYLAGGADSMANPTDRVDVYDEDAGTWSTLTLPNPTFRADAVTIGDRVFVGGGLPPSDEIQIYDTVAGTWSTTQMTTPLFDAALVAVGQYLVVAGGSPGGPPTNYSDQARIYDTATSTWSAVTLFEPISELAAVALDGRAILAGGRDGGAFFSSRIQEVVPSAGTSMQVATLSSARVAMACGTVGPKAWFVGGLDNLSAASSNYDVFDGTTDSHSSGTVSAGVISAAGARAGNTLVVAGGFAGGSATSAVSLFQVDGSVVSTNLPGNISATGFSAASTGSSAYFAGATNGSGQVLPRVFVYTVADELVADVATVSVSAGGVVGFELDAGPSAAGDLYLLLGSTSGTAPGFVVDCVTLPLNIDSYLLAMLSGANSPPFASTFGALDATGEAEASITVPAGVAPGLAGVTADHAFARIDLGLFKVAAASNVQSVTFVP